MNEKNKLDLDDELEIDDDKRKNNLENILNSYKMTNNEIDDEDSQDSYELRLDKEIEANCEFKEYVDKLEVDEKDDEELIKMDKKSILDFKNSQIKKYKQYIGSLEKEKNDLIENFKETTNVLLEKIKELEEKNYGERPQTAMIMDGIKNNSNKRNQNNHNINNINSKNNLGGNPGNFPRYSNLNTNEINNVTISKSIKNSKNLEEEFFGKSEENKSNDETNQKEERCVKCKKYFPKQEFAKHSLICLRKPMILCKICNESLEENEKESHINYYRSIETIIKAIDDNNTDIFIKCINHNFEHEKKILDEEKGYYLVHYVSEKGSFKIFSLCIEKHINFDQVTTKEKNTSLVSLNFTKDDRNKE